jgi:hypothetical protein
MKSRKSFLIRIDPRLYDELAGWAAQEFRSVNGQIEFLLREAVARRRRSGQSTRESSTESRLSEPESDAEDHRR